MNAPLTGGFHERVVQHQNASLRPRNKRGELGPNSLERLTKGLRLSSFSRPVILASLRLDPRGVGGGFRVTA